MSKFKLRASTPVEISGSASAPSPISREEFVSGASMVRSQVGDRPVKPIRLNFDLDPAVHQRLRLLAAERSKTVAEIVRQLILRELG